MEGINKTLPNLPLLSEWFELPLSFKRQEALRRIITSRGFGSYTTVVIEGTVNSLDTCRESVRPSTGHLPIPSEISGTHYWYILCTRDPHEH